MATKVLSDTFDVVTNLGLNTFHKLVGFLFRLTILVALPTAIVTALVVYWLTR